MQSQKLDALENELIDAKVIANLPSVLTATLYKHVYAALSNERNKMKKKIKELTDLGIFEENIQTADLYNASTALFVLKDNSKYMFCVSYNKCYWKKIGLYYETVDVFEAASKTSEESRYIILCNLDLLKGEEPANFR